MDEYISREAALKKIQMQLLDLEADQDKGEYSELCENRGARDALDEAIYDIRTLKAADVQPVNQWISVEDRLPESEKEVLVWYKYTWDAGFTSYGFGINVWYSNAKQWRDGCLLKGVEVLYWQPLPEPPKDGDIE